MMEFLDFCRSHGILIDRVPVIGKWCRFFTEDHPKKRNGTVKFMGDYGFAKNQAIDLSVNVWQSGRTQGSDRTVFAQKRKEVERETRATQDKAAAKAKWILGQCEVANHPYLIKKGFTDDVGYVWDTKGVRLLVIPMRSDDVLIGCQLIDEQGQKRFLYGQRTTGAEFVIKGGGSHVLCEGYATGLSVRAGMKALRKPATIHICFSAHNLVKIAGKLTGGMVVADHDKENPITKTRAGHEAVRMIGWPFWMSEREGEDANDFHKRVGLFAFAMAIKKPAQKIPGSG